MRQGVFNFPFFSMQLKTEDHKHTNVMEPICTRKDITIPPNDRLLVTLISQMYVDTAVTGNLQPSNTITGDGDIAFCAALVTLTTGQVEIYLNNFTDHPYTLKRGSHVANFSVMTPVKTKYVKPIDTVTTWHLLQNNHESAAFYVSSLIKCSRQNISMRILVPNTGRSRGSATTYTYTKTYFDRATKSSGVRKTQSSG